MNGPRRIQRALQAVTAVALAVAAGGLVWPSSVPASATPPVGLDRPPATSTLPVAEPDAVRRIVEGNIFSTARAAPAVRYRVAGSGAASDPSAFSADATEESSSDGSAEGVPRLYGTVVGPAGARALMRLDATVEGAEFYREGDRGGTYRVEKIEESSVVISGPRGRVVLRLIQPEGPTR